MRMGMAIRIRPEKIEEYKALHATPWPDVNAALKEANIHDYSIFLLEAENLLFGVWDYRGDDFERDMKRLDDLEINHRWLALTDPCQMRFASAKEGEWWSMMEQVFHLK